MPKDAASRRHGPAPAPGPDAKAYSESSKPPSATPDKSCYSVASTPRAEVLARRGAAGVTPQLLDEAARLTPSSWKRWATASKPPIPTSNTQGPRRHRLASRAGALDDAGRLTFDLRKIDGRKPAGQRLLRPVPARRAGPAVQSQGTRLPLRPAAASPEQAPGGDQVLPHGRRRTTRITPPPSSP